MSPDVEHLRADIGLRTIIDLRCPEEAAASSPAATFARSAIAILELPSVEPVFVPGVALEDVYLHILRTKPDRIAAAVVAVAESELPAVFHCTAGKDRTGLVAAVVLGALGVPDVEIARDYGLTQCVLPALLERVAKRLARVAPQFSLPPDAHTADVATMQTVLRSIRADHGSMLGYALDIGVPARVIHGLRDRILD
jgi:protein-tyrosine phosphatase